MFLRVGRPRGTDDVDLVEPGPCVRVHLDQGAAAPEHRVAGVPVDVDGVPGLPDVQVHGQKQQQWQHPSGAPSWTG